MLCNLSGFRPHSSSVTNRFRRADWRQLPPGGSVLVVIFGWFRSNTVQLVLEALHADAAAFHAVLPGQVLVLGLQLQTGDLHGFAVLVQGNHHEVGVVDPVALAPGIFHIGVHADLHGAGAHPGQLALDDHHVILVSAVEEGQIVHGGGGHIAAAVALGHDAGGLVDPLHQNAAEEAVCAVEVGGADQIHGFDPGVVYGLVYSFHGMCSFHIPIGFL